ncbi:MAG TPA: sodium:alanine symporter family protein [Candidatus Anaerotignum merdipullorum]|nr:sodium:alanine symporter family protein [Candidatus Anaerotignum merdipullorum]
MAILESIQEIVWGPVTILLLFATGLYYTIRLKGIQLKLGKSFQYMLEKEEGHGDVSTFASLCTALAATIGTGSIVGVATALKVGGPGALFWMWISAILGMATKYAECVLAVKFRIKDDKGQMAGGPMYYIENGLGKKFKWLAVLFAFFGTFTALLGCGTFPQVNAIAESVSSAFHISVPIVGAVITILVAVVVFGGITSISKVAEFIVPIMAILYIGGCVIALILNASLIPEAFSRIFHAAFQPYAMGGGIAGTVIISVMTAMRTGVARGVYTNEAGLGSAPIVVAAAQTNSPVRQGLVSMIGVFLTTLIICTMTGLVILTSGLLETTNLDGSILTNTAFQNALPGNIGLYIVSIGLVFFAFTTIIGWCYYGERCVVYLANGTKLVKPFRILYIICIAAAPYLSLQAIWTLADITNALMAFPNLIGLLLLSPVVIKETNAFFADLKQKENA